MRTLYRSIGFLLLFQLLAATEHEGGVYRTNTGNVEFYSHTDLEDILAVNHKVKAAFDAKNGKMQFSLLIKDFKFPKALMQEHFNENYMESDVYPRATFTGTIDSVAAIRFNEDGVYTSPVSGKLTIKDVTRSVQTQGRFTVKGDVVTGKATFSVRPEDYHVEIPALVRGKIAQSIEIRVDVDFKHDH